MLNQELIKYNKESLIMEIVSIIVFISGWLMYVWLYSAIDLQKLKEIIIMIIISSVILGFVIEYIIT